MKKLPKIKTLWPIKKENGKHQLLAIGVSLCFKGVSKKYL